MNDFNGASHREGGAAEAASHSDVPSNGTLSNGMGETSDITSAEPTPRAALDRAFDSLGVEHTDGLEGTEGSESHSENENERGKSRRAQRVSQNGNSSTPNGRAPYTGVTPNGVGAKAAPSVEEPPSRFSTEAKNAWAYAPPAIKAEIHRAVSEMEAGIEKHRDAAQRWEGLRDFEVMANQHGTDVRGALSRYVAADMKLNKDLIGGLEEIVSHYGYSLYDVAAHVLKQTPDAHRSQAEAQNRALKQQLQQMQQQLGGVSSQMAMQNHARTLSGIQNFAEQHPNFDQISEEIAFFLKSGRTNDLEEAYALAERLHGGSANSGRASLNSGLNSGMNSGGRSGLAAQTRKGTLSVTGAPSFGSNPYNRKPPSSAREALDRAFANSGLG